LLLFHLFNFHKITLMIDYYKKLIGDFFPVLYTSLLRVIDSKSIIINFSG